MKTIVLAFDIERSGAFNNNDTIAIGASVVDSDFKELDTLFLAGYTDDTKFEQRCWDEFWSKNNDTLEKLRYHGDKSYQDRQKEMITKFQEFRSKWETYAKENDLKLELVSDNNVFDGGFINVLINGHTDDMPIPFTSSSRTYDSFWETHSQQRGLLMAVDPSFTGEWGLSDRINKLYDVPTPEKKHDHNPANDAYTIAYDQQVLLNIRSGNIQRRL